MLCSSNILPQIAFIYYGIGSGKEIVKDYFKEALLDKQKQPFSL
jgi:hypothetical protein